MPSTPTRLCKSESPRPLITTVRMSGRWAKYASSSRPDSSSLASPGSSTIGARVPSKSKKRDRLGAARIDCAISASPALNNDWHEDIHFTATFPGPQNVHRKEGATFKWLLLLRRRESHGTKPGQLWSTAMQSFRTRPFNGPEESVFRDIQRGY